MNGILFGVGVGPGDPDLLTLKAVRVMQACPVIAVPDAGGEQRLALRIAAAYIEDQELLELSMPMTTDRELLERSHAAAAERLCAELRAGRDAAFLTLGDPGIYSTFTYLHRRVEAAGFAVQIVPGVPSVCAAAAALGTDLCIGPQALHILSASHDGVEEALALPGNKVLMKSGRQLTDTLRLLEQRGLLEHSMLAQQVGLEGERLVRDLRAETPDSGYFTTILVKE